MPTKAQMAAQIADLKAQMAELSQENEHFRTMLDNHVDHHPYMEMCARYRRVIQDLSSIVYELTRTVKGE